MRFDFPQVELHLHLDGSFRPETVWELAERKGVAMPAADLAGYRAYLAATTDCASVNEYLERFELPLQVMQDAEALTRVTRELVEDLADRGTAYAEIRFAPQLHTREGMTQRQAVEAVLAGRRQGCEARPGIDIGILLCMMCVGPETANWEANAETVAVAAEYLGQGVVGIDLAGAEGIVPLRNFAPLFRRASELRIPFTCHAGDSPGPDTVADALDFGARRIGHGHHIYQDPALVRRAADLGVTRVDVVANKIRDDADREFVRSRIPEENLLGFISYNPDVIDADRKGLSPYDCSPQALEEIRAIKARIDQE